MSAYELIVSINKFYADYRKILTRKPELIFRTKGLSQVLPQNFTFFVPMK